MSTFDVKLKQLLLTYKRTDSVLDSNKDTAIKRQLEALKALTNEVETSRRGVEALKIEQKVNEDEVATRNSQVETELEKADDDVKRLEKWQDDCKLEKERNAFEEKLKYELKLHETKLKLESEHQANGASYETQRNSREILQDATFELHKWSSNVPQLAVDEVYQVSELSDEQSYAKTQLILKPKESQVLGLKWDKQSDTLKISFPSEESGPEWLSDPANWPDNPVTKSSPESAAETKISRDLVYIAKSTETTTDELDKLLERNTLRRTLRVSAWINRFIHNCRAKEKRSGPLDTEEIETAKFWWIKLVQLRDTVEQHYKETSAQLGLETDDRGII
ncbi:Hypothetical predicted protein, partial [Paramuricea clavata]